MFGGREERGVVPVLYVWISEKIVLYFKLCMLVFRRLSMN